jgi:hypothetical protein
MCEAPHTPGIFPSTVATGARALTPFGNLDFCPGDLFIPQR